VLLAQFYYYLYGKNEIYLTDIHRWNFTRDWDYHTLDTRSHQINALSLEQ